MARILVTGASGYIGNVLVDQLLKTGHQVTGLDWMVFGGFPLKPFRNDPNFELLQQDLREIPARALRNIDMVCDLAALPNEACCDLDPALAREINLLARSRLARISKAMGVKRYICLTSCCHYDPAAGNEADEETPLAAPSTYAKYNKDVEESLLAASTRDFSVTVLRAASTYGLSRRMRFDLMANAVMLQAFKTGKMSIRGNGEQSLPLIHVRDLGRAIDTVLKAPTAKVRGQVFNAASENKSVREVAEAAEAALPKQLAIGHLPVETEPPIQTVATTKLSEHTGFEPRITLEQGMMEIYIALQGGRIEPSVSAHTAKLHEGLIGKGLGAPQAVSRSS